MIFLVGTGQAGQVGIGQIGLLNLIRCALFILLSMLVGSLVISNGM